MPARMMWLLRTMLAEHGIDESEIDPELTFDENKESIERRFGVVLKLKPGRHDRDDRLADGLPDH